METWRVAREQSSPGFRWSRALRLRSVPLAAQRTVFRGHEEQVRGAAYCARWCRRVVSVGDDGTVRFWEAVSSRETHCRRAPGQGLRGGLRADGGHVASAGEDGVLRLWDADGCELASLSRPPRAGLQRGLRARRAPLRLRLPRQDGARLGRGAARATAVPGRSDDNPKAPAGHNATASSAVFSADGRRVVSGGWDRTVRVWDAATCATPVPDETLPAGQRRGDLPDGLCICRPRRRPAHPLGRRKLRRAGPGLPCTRLARLGDVFAGRRLRRLGLHHGKLQVWDGHTLAESDLPDGPLTARSTPSPSARTAADSSRGRGTGRRRVEPAGAVPGRRAARRQHQRAVPGLLRGRPAAGRRRLPGGDSPVGYGHRASKRRAGPATPTQFSRSRSGRIDRRMVSGLRDDTVRVWDVAAGGRWPASAATRRRSATSPSLRTGGASSPARGDRTGVRDVDGGIELLRLAGHEGIVQAVAFDPAGNCARPTAEVGTGVVRCGTRPTATNWPGCTKRSAETSRSPSPRTAKAWRCAGAGGTFHVWDQEGGSWGPAWPGRDEATLRPAESGLRPRNGTSSCAAGSGVPAGGVG